MYHFISEQSIYQYFGEDDLEMIKEMVQIILCTNIRDLKQLDNFKQQDDYTSIQKCCHKAKPTMSYIGALKTKKILEEIEHNHVNFQELNNRLQSHLIEIETELNQFVKALN